MGLYVLSRECIIFSSAVCILQILYTEYSRRLSDQFQEMNVTSCGL